MPFLLRSEVNEFTLAGAVLADSLDRGTGKKKRRGADSLLA
ncbi:MULTISPECIES: hypothetical protein [Fibrobacter]|nr:MULTISPECIES: hypothetical protein [Fibrobacter]